MSQRSTDTAGSGRPHRIVLDENTSVPFRHIGLPELAEWERERFRMERDRLRMMRDDYSKERYEQLLDGIRDRYDKNLFRWELPSEQEFFQRPEGALLMLRIMTGSDDQTIMRAFRERYEETITLMELVIRESFEQMRGKGTEGASGNPQAEAKGERPAGTQRPHREKSHKRR